MRILGIDPGVATVGFGVIETQGGRQQMIQYGAITTPAGQPLAARLVQIAQDMETLINRFRPDEMSIEELFFSKNITTGIDKHQVMDMTRRLLKLKSIPRPDDAADALAIAMCRARSATSLLRQKDPDVKETV